jgi:DNA-binding transcriptional regulator YiaG
MTPKPMSPREFLYALHHTKFSLRRFAKFIHADEREVRRWAKGTSRIPETTAGLLRLMIQIGLKAEDVT